MLRATFAALAVASALVLSAPVAATAAVPSAVGGFACAGTSLPYANSVTVSSDSPTVTPGGTVTITFSNGYFTPGEVVTVSVDGVNASSVELQTASASGLGSLATTADGSGAVTVSATFPQSAQGTYTVTGMSASGCGGVDVIADRASVASTGAAASTNQLAFTGGTLPTILLVTGGGALIFGSILLMIRSRMRRHQAE